MLIYVKNNYILLPILGKIEQPTLNVQAVVSLNSSLLEGSILGNYRGVCQWKQKPLRIVSQQSKEV